MTIVDPTLDSELPGGPETGASAEYVRALDRGLSVLHAFGPDTSALTLAEVAKTVELSPATTRRLLMTLHALGYVRTDGRTWSLAPRVLEFGHAYLATNRTWDIVRTRLEDLAREVGESTSAGVLDNDDVLYTVRVPYRRIMSMDIEVGTRIPAFASSMGRVLLAAQSGVDFAGLLSRAPADRTLYTVKSVTALKRAVQRAGRDGFCLVEQELEAGVQCVAAPVHDQGQTIAAVAISAHTGRVSPDEMRERILPALLVAAADINRSLALRF
ncbi:IclR family transcriptional regulator domain-containing protein [[Mycobacterium] wendilense]|uniref:IclR family transcriptional regulator C-terminal domain-containing protein n=1 Tax=[Mycobacterium] wendilense TaxID=3064284 RepID=A0ABN9NUQ8_9MYCO|nr:IclR family transcriptional regulator C-terminal domain-containing protein [Mycolicibacterium sp. MU0050]CAJ1580064.1 IclR family transcriptional regulator C-terminal domain-containing protein [Mycolicibacterium sp. MU0050]